MMRLRPILLCAAILSLVLYWNVYAAMPEITVYKDPTCQCCDGWIAHLRADGFQVAVKEIDASALRELKQKYAIPITLQACHTAIVDGYVIEGHVPAAEIRRLLQEHPKATGLVVPGMPMGSPGMEGQKTEKYSVLLFDSNGTSSVYHEYSGQ